MKDYTLIKPIEGLDKQPILNLRERRELTAGDLVKIEKEGGPGMGGAEENMRMLARVVGLDYSEVLKLSRKDAFAAVRVFLADPT